MCGVFYFPRHEQKVERLLVSHPTHISEFLPIYQGNKRANTVPDHLATVENTFRRRPTSSLFKTIRERCFVLFPARCPFVCGGGSLRFRRMLCFGLSTPLAFDVLPVFRMPLGAFRDIEGHAPTVVGNSYFDSMPDGIWLAVVVLWQQFKFVYHDMIRWCTDPMATVFYVWHTGRTCYTEPLFRSIGKLCIILLINCYYYYWYWSIDQRGEWRCVPI